MIDRTTVEEIKTSHTKSQLNLIITDIKRPQGNKCRGWPAVSDRRLQELNQLLWVSGVGPGSGHHLAWPQEGHFQSHGVVVEDQHLILLLPQVLQSHLGMVRDRCSGEQEVMGRDNAKWQKKRKGNECQIVNIKEPLSDRKDSKQVAAMYLVVI